MGKPIRRDHYPDGRLKPHNRCRKWELQVSVNDNGRYRKRSKRFAGTQREAKAELARFEVEVAEERKVTCPLCSVWLEGFNENRRLTSSVSKSTLKQFEAAQKSFLGFIDDKPIDKVTVADCGRWRDDMLLTLKPSTTATRMAILSPAFEQAAREELIARNPFRYARPPKVIKETRKAPSEEEIANAASMLDANDPYERAVLYMMFCGMRAGEVLAIDPHKDIADYILHIHSNMLKDGEISDTTKGRRDRFAPIPKALWDVTVVEEDDEFLCQLPGGLKLTYQKLDTWWRKNRKRLGLKEYRLHDLRHGYITQLCRNGVSPKVVQDIAGHHSINVTMNVYAHVDNTERLEAAASLDELFAANLRQKSQNAR